VLARGEFLTAYTPYQPEMSQGVLQAIFEYQTAICELTGMDVSNASGYDGTTVAADACYVAKHATGRSKVVLAETLNPQVRQVVKTYAPGFGLEVVEVPHADGTTDPDELRPRRGTRLRRSSSSRTSSAASSRARASPPRGESRRAGRRARRPVSLGVLEAPGDYGCAIAIGEGQGAGTTQSYGGPHYGFLAARSEFIRRMPGRIVGETVDAAGERGYVADAADAGAAHPPGEGDLEHHDEPDAARARRLVHLRGSARRAAETGGDLHGLASYAKERSGRRLGVSDQATFKEFAVASDGPRERRSAARARGVHPGYALGARLRGLDDALLVASPRSGRPARSTASRRSSPREADLREVAAGPRALDAPDARTLPPRRSRRSSPRRAAAPARARRAELVRHFTRLPTGTSASTPASTRSAPAR
jgi:glycine dehydrogenase subunit 1